MGDGLTLLLGRDVVAGELQLRDVEEAGGHGLSLVLREESSTEDESA